MFHVLQVTTIDPIDVISPCPRGRGVRGRVLPGERPTPD